MKKDEMPLDAAMDNVLAWRLGEAFSATAKENGDYIDQGLALVRHLNSFGFDVIIRSKAQ